MNKGNLTVKKIRDGFYSVRHGVRVIATMERKLFQKHGAFYTVTSGVLAGTQSFDRIALVQQIHDAFNA